MTLAQLFKSRSRKKPFSPEKVAGKELMHLLETGQLVSHTVHRRGEDGYLRTKHLRMTPDDMLILRRQMTRMPLELDWKGAQYWQDARDNQEYRIALAIVKHRHLNRPNGYALS